MRTNQWRRGILIGILLLVAFWLVSLIVGLAGKVQLARTQAHQVQEQYQRLEKRKTVLQSNLSQLSTPLGQDAAIRTAFGVARPGEEVIVVVPPATSTPPAPKSWWQDVVAWFQGL